MCQNRTRTDHYQITNNVGSNTRSDNPPLQPGLKCFTLAAHQQSEVQSEVINLGLGTRADIGE